MTKCFKTSKFPRVWQQGIPPPDRLSTSLAWLTHRTTVLRGIQSHCPLLNLDILLEEAATQRG
eukprot:CAMPEP_0118661008 /NCGR_PEP_ID=MMETSP0785-20121206/16025_1 /TAXON_ID=91992 /ORGANISM="Bolidomonas pacifica, Strain CCMP 1866" /LENGTH=62 /DNA_ID=CAMNT_0006554369 /DNA_START=188 /DNA_END=376 /DNA_ORIENTATION=+